jgi:hypothetical protein
MMSHTPPKISFSKYLSQQLESDNECVSSEWMLWGCILFKFIIWTYLSSRTPNNLKKLSQLLSSSNSQKSVIISPSLH